MQQSKYPTIYEKIDHVKGKIRLLAILPSIDHEARICCDLFLARINIDSDYTALSYCWGPLEPAEVITLNSEDFSVTPNLHAALKQLRSTEEIRFMWIDALCIDQSNAVEKGLQVGQMGDIYANAAYTIMWLGNESENCSLVLKLTQILVGWLGGIEVPIETLSGAQAEAVRDVFTNKFYESYWVALGVLLSAEYWRRAWIVQEVVLSKNLVAMCGSVYLPWDNLRILSQVMELTEGLEVNGMTYQYDASVSRYLMSTVKELQTMRKAIQDKHVQTLVHGLFACGLRSATDHRDYIYSMLTIVRDSYGIVPNYELCAHCVYVDAVEKVITKDKSLDILSLCKGFSAERRAKLEANRNVLSISINSFRNIVLIGSNIMLGAEADQDKDNDKDGCPESLKSTGCLCDFQVGEIGKQFIATYPFLHPGFYLGVKSWVPNFHATNDTSTLPQQNWFTPLSHGGQCYFRASGTSEATFLFSTSKEHLTVSGFIFDKVSYTTGIQEVEESAAPSAKSALSYFTFPKLWVELERRGPSPNFYGSDLASLQIALTKAVVCGMKVNGDKLSDKDISAMAHDIGLIVEGKNRRNVEDNLHFTASFFDQFLMRNSLNDMIITSKGAVGSTEKEVREGDLVCILLGAKVPFILHPDEDKYYLIGEAYIDGIMEGELMKDFEQGKYEKMDFCLR